MADLRFKDKNEFLKCYEEESINYDKNRLTTYEDKKVLSEQLNILDKIFKSKSSKSILEAGCGTGRILLPLTRKGYVIQGFDLSQNMLNVLKKKNPKIHTKLGDIEKIPFEDNSFDLVYSITVVFHLNDFRKAFEEMYRVTKVGGYVVFDLPNRNSVWTRLSLFLSPNKKRSRLYTLNELNSYFSSYNYEIDGIFSYARTFYKIPILKYFIKFLDDYFKLPVSQRTQFIIIVQKN